MDRITISFKELNEILNLPKEKETFVETWLTVIEKGFIFKEFKLLIPEMQQIYKVKLEGEKENTRLKIIKIQKNEYGETTFRGDYDVTVIEYLERLTEFVKKGSKAKDIFELYKETDSEFIDIIVPISFIQYVMREGKKKKIEYIEPKEKSKKSNKAKNKYRNKANQTYGILDCIKIYEKKERKGTHEYSVDEFERRGFYRHLGNGKIIFVKPTKVKPKKKKGNEKITRKDYKL